MSMNIEVVDPSYGEIFVFQTPTSVTYKIIGSPDPKKEYIDWIKSFDNPDFDSHLNEIEENWTADCKVWIV